MLAECLTHASRTASNGSGERASNTCLTCPGEQNNFGNGANSVYVWRNEKTLEKDLSLWDGGADHQLVGKVKAYQDKDG